MAFSPKYQTYKEWRKAQSNVSSYVKQIDRLHTLYPQASLSQLRRHPTEKQKPLSNLKKKFGNLPPIESLTENQKGQYELSLEAVRLMRRQGMSLTEAAKQINLSPKTIKYMAGKALEYNGSRYKAKPLDHLERMMMFYDEKGPMTIRVRSSKVASLIGQYHAAVRKYTHTGDFSDVLTFKGKAIIDATGTRRDFMTGQKQLDEFIRSGEVRFESIYQFTI